MFTILSSLSFDSSSLLAAIDLAATSLRDFANRADAGDRLAELFGEENRTELEEILGQWRGGDFAIVPPVEILSGEELNGANGAFSATTGRIYLSATFLQGASAGGIVNTLLEEIGHRIDSAVNTVDTAGDEGAIFAALVSGESLSAGTLQALQSEDDTGVINVNGQLIAVEMQNFSGTPGNDLLNGTPEDDYFSYSIGNDTINGGGGSDRYQANYRSASSGLVMTYDTATGSGTITAGTEIDTFTSIESFDEFQGTAFSDVIFGGAASEDRYGLSGGSGNDTISGNAGNDRIYGEDGNDVLNGGTNNDNLYGGNGNDVLYGGAGDDALYGGNGNDVLNGDAGDDFFDADAGNDTINGGSGIDRYNAYYYRNASSGLTMTYDPVTGNGTITTGTEIDTFTSIESFNDGLWGTAFNDVIFGGTVSGDSYYGGSGNDTISANAGGIEIYGEDGDDVLKGASGNDSLRGGDGNDILQGTDSNDIQEQDYLEGGSGNDVFVLANSTTTFYDDGNYASVGNGDYARIVDFDLAEDTIQLRGSSGDYLFKVSRGSTYLYIDKPSTEPDELIAVVQFRTGLSLSASYFSYIAPVSAITLSVSASGVTEDGTPNLVYTFTRSDALTNALTVNYTVSGTATNGTDYAAIGTSVTFAPGSATATVTVNPTADTTIEPDETVTLTLVAGTGYTIDTPSPVTGTILNDDYSSIESRGNTSLIKDGTGKLYTRAGSGTPLAVSRDGTAITETIYDGWRPLAAETLNGTNRILWKRLSDNLLTYWEMNGNWSNLTTSGTYGTANTPDALAPEIAFGIDLNGDTLIGQAIEIQGNTSLLKDGTGKLYTLSGDGTSFAVSRDGTHITETIYDGWRPLAAETLDGVNRVLWKRLSDNLLTYWEMNANWSNLNGNGTYGLSNTAAALVPETAFGIDLNGNGLIGG